MSEITTLKHNEIFVFGSNTAGRHGRGAALQAKEQFGAVYGVGEGLTGQCYAFPTLEWINGKLEKFVFPAISLEQHREKLYKCCLDNPDKTFLLTKVGCGLAGYDETFICQFFRFPPTNLVVPDDWMTINSFTGRYRFLSNFFIEPDGTHVEGEYQTEKCLLDSDKERIIGATPGRAKALGKKVKLRGDWDDVKLGIMTELVLAKFSDHPELKEQLLATGEAELIEGNSWHDQVWGCCTCQFHQNTGKNWLGKTLSDVRFFLR